MKLKGINKIEQHIEKLGVKPRMVRTRALALVPMGALLYMFVWPLALSLALCGLLVAARLSRDLGRQMKSASQTTPGSIHNRPAETHD